MIKPYKYHYRPMTADFWADYWADTPLWADGNLGMVGLPLSEELKADLRRWQSQFDRIGLGLDVQDLPAEFHVEGRRLLACLRNELGPGWTIVSCWYDEGGEVGPPDASS